MVWYSYNNNNDICILKPGWVVFTQRIFLYFSDTNSIHEPPRRIMYRLPGTELTLSDYLFPGEGPNEAKLSLEELLDIRIGEKGQIHDIEGQAGRLS